MPNINSKFLEKITNLELLKQDKNDFIGIIDWKKHKLPKEQLNLQTKAIITNFIDHLTNHLEEEQKIITPKE